jgi:hypothetical protein
MPTKSLKNKSVTKKIVKDKSKKEKQKDSQQKKNSLKKENKKERKENKKERKENNKNNKKENKLKNDVLDKLEQKKRTLDLLKALLLKKIKNMHQKKLYLQNHSMMKNNSCPRKIFIIKK